jgi:hypothetical protein
MSKQTTAPVVKEAAKIEDRPITMAPKASIQAGHKFFREKCAAENKAIQEGFKPLSVLENKELMFVLIDAVNGDLNPAQLVIARHAAK